MKKFLLLFKRYTFIPVPKKIIADLVQLPQAIRFFPVLGLFCGAAVYFSARYLDFLPDSLAAIILLAVNIIFGGGHLLRDMITVADGLTGEQLIPPNMQALGSSQINNKESAGYAEGKKNKSSSPVGKAGLIWGIIWLLLVYLLYLSYFSANLFAARAFLLSPIIGYWLINWIIYSFPAKQPAWLHNNFKRADFIVASLLAMLFLLPFASLTLFISVLIAFFGVYIFALYRQRSAGALVDSCYGAAGLWSQVLFLLAWLAFARFF